MNNKLNSNNYLPCDKNSVTELFSDPSLPLVVVVTKTNWNEPPRMRHQVTRQLLRFFNVLYVQKNHNNKSDTLKKISNRQVIFIPAFEGTFLPRAYAWLPVYQNAVNNRYVSKIDKLVRSFGAKTNILINFEFDFFQVMNLETFDLKFYICVDEFPKMQGSKAKKSILKRIIQENLLQLYENKVASLSDICLTCHYPLQRKLKRVNRNVEMFFHANDLKIKYGKISEKKLIRNRPINVGFMGYIDRRLDIAILNEILCQQDMKLFLIGQFHNINRNVFESDLSSQRLTITGNLYGDELYDYMSHLDVLIMPYIPTIPDVQVLTTSSKLFQYIATGKPIVISDLPNYIKMPEGIYYRAKKTSDFIRKIRDAFDEDNEELIKLRLKIATENTWEKRGDQLYTIISDALPVLKD